MMEITFKQAIKNTLLYELRKNRNSVFVSQDIGVFGGEYKISKGFDVQIPEERIIEVPVSENAYIGSSVGLSLNGFNVITEVPGTKFLIRALDPIINYASKLNLLGTKTPGSLLIRCPIGYTPYSSVQDNESIESVLAHFPGIKIVYPSTPKDAMGLMRSAFFEHEPVLFFENKNLYNTKGEISETAEERIPIGKASIVREGNDITVITYGSMVKEALKASDVAYMSDVKVEVIDLRTIKPIDKDTVIKSVKKTGRAIILYEGYKTCSVGSEIAGILAESEAFDYLEAPIIRMCNDDNITPFSPMKAKEVLPSSGKLLEKIMQLVEY
ncbi:transketolase C-terminal domain-containing protein [Anaerofustis sp.]|uniref:alpha-ketoacid dehydrogenase subunit beta n=1 Tax=Anaerofustis sp. TaxID=1872517 RepID=UPI0025C347C7|nr:transketolase C-terminal domain-containing protein [Anaerofustis sp.]